VPTFKELGYDIVEGAYRGLPLPGTPDAIIKKLADAFDKTMRDPEVKKKMDQNGFKTEFMGPEASLALVKKKTAEYEVLMKEMAGSKSREYGKEDLDGGPSRFDGEGPRIFRKGRNDDYADLRVRTELLRMPLPRPMMSGSSSGKKGGPVSHINMPVVFITTEDGVRGLGYAWSLLGGATATRCVLKDDFAPLLVGEDALDNERLWNKLYRRLQTVGRVGLVTQAMSAVDLALWDIKEGLPGFRCTSSWAAAGERTVLRIGRRVLYMTVSEMVAAFEGYLSQE